MEILLRQVGHQDAEAVRFLSHQLGYPLPFEQILQNITAIMASNDHNAFVAVHADKVIGWIGVAQAIMIESLPYCEINGLVIDKDYRGRGIGKILIEKAKQWAREKGNDTLRLRCNVKRKEAHLFYYRLGFKETKEQKVLEIRITD